MIREKCSILIEDRILLTSIASADGGTLSTELGTAVFLFPPGNQGLADEPTFAQRRKELSEERVRGRRADWFHT
jgi:hypothetical protein